MATPITDTRPSFSRLTETRTTSSWRRAAPIVLVLVGFIALLAYLVSKISSYSQEVGTAHRDAAASRQQYESSLKRSAELQRDLTLARSAGRTTVILQSKAKDGPWAAVTWGESEGGTSWMRVSAYGLKPQTGKEYHAWIVPKAGEPMHVGALEIDEDGSAFALAGNLPAIDQGKSVLISLDSSGAKAPDQVVIEAPLPALKPIMTAAAAPPTEKAEPQKAESK